MVELENELVFPVSALDAFSSEFVDKDEFPLSYGFGDPGFEAFFAFWHYLLLSFVTAASFVEAVLWKVFIAFCAQHD